MIYELNDLLRKMGAPEVEEKKKVEWYYFDQKGGDGQNTLAGLATIRLDAAGELLVAEMKHVHENIVDDDGEFHAERTDYFQLTAERTARPGHYRVLSVSVDGATYEKPSKAIIELAVSVFHARAIDISLRMIEQSFSKDDMLSRADDHSGLFRSFLGGRDTPLRKRTEGSISASPRFAGRRTFGAAAEARQRRAQEAVTLTASETGATIIPFRPRNAAVKAG